MPEWTRGRLRTVANSYRRLAITLPEETEALSVDVSSPETHIRIAVDEPARSRLQLGIDALRRADE
jgi:hypothetical protein